MAYDDDRIVTVEHAKKVNDWNRAAINRLSAPYPFDGGYIYDDLKNIVPKSLYYWHYGTINMDTGEDGTVTKTRLRSDYVHLPITESTQYCMVGNREISGVPQVYVILHFYNLSKTWIGKYSANWYAPTTSGITFTLPSGARYVRFLLKIGEAGTQEFGMSELEAFDFACYHVSDDDMGYYRQAIVMQTDVTGAYTWSIDNDVCTLTRNSDSFDVYGVIDWYKGKNFCLTPNIRTIQDYLVFEARSSITGNFADSDYLYLSLNLLVSRLMLHGKEYADNNKENILLLGVIGRNGYWFPSKTNASLFTNAIAENVIPSNSDDVNYILGV